jgi:hypothetical protein
MDSTTLKPTVETHPAYTLVRFYASLDGYIDGFDPRPTYMVAMLGGKEPPEVWLAWAVDSANKLPDHREQLMAVLAEVKRLVARKDYPAARRITSNGFDMANAQVRILAMGKARSGTR